MTPRTILLIAGLLAAGPALAQPSQSFGRQPGPGMPADPAASMPPALRAALQSGNIQNMQQAIRTLGAGNPAQTANLALQTVSVAERMLPTNPQAAVMGAAAAVETTRDPSLAQAAPRQIFEILNTALRIAMAPMAQQAAPSGVLSLALGIAQTLGNPVLAANFPVGSMKDSLRHLADSPKLAATNPGTATQLKSLLGAPSSTR